MRKARFTEDRLVALIREADREPVSVVAKRHELSEQTIYTWSKRFGGFQANEVRRLKLETENVRLRKLVVERDLEIEIMKKVAAKNVWSAPSVSGMRRLYLRQASSQRPCSSSIRDTEASDRTASFAKFERKLTSFQQARQTDPLPPRGLPSLTELQEGRRAPPFFARHGNPRSSPPVKRCRAESDTNCALGQSLDRRD